MTINSQDLGYVATIDTYNMFDGGDFEDRLIEEYSEKDYKNYEYDDFEWDYDHDQIVKDFAKARAEFLEAASDVIDKCEVETTGSPREYNFSTDYAMFKITYDEQKVNDYVEQHEDDYSTWYRESGWYEHTEWRDDDDEQKDENRKIARLDYYLNHTIDHDEALYALGDLEAGIYMDNTNFKLKEDK